MVVQLAGSLRGFPVAQGYLSSPCHFYEFVDSSSILQARGVIRERLYELACRGFLLYNKYVVLCVSLFVLSLVASIAIYYCPDGSRILSVDGKPCILPFHADLHSLVYLER